MLGSSWVARTVTVLGSYAPPSLAADRLMRCCEKNQGPLGSGSASSLPYWWWGLPSPANRKGTPATIDFNLFCYFPFRSDSLLFSFSLSPFCFSFSVGDRFDGWVHMKELTVRRRFIHGGGGLLVTRKKRGVVGDGTHSGDIVWDGYVGSIYGKSYCDAEELVLVKLW